MAASYPLDLLKRSEKGSAINATEHDANLTKIEENLNDISGKARKFLSVAAMVAVTDLTVGDTVETTAYYSTQAGGGAVYEIVASGTGTADGGEYIDLTGSGLQAQCLNLIGDDGLINVRKYGAKGDGTTDDSASIQAAIAYADSSKVSASANSRIVLESGKSYLFATGLTFPDRVGAECSGALLKYSGTGVAVTLGDSDSVLSKGNCLLDFRMQLVDKASKGVRLRGTKGAHVRGYIEGLYQPFDSSRTNIGVEVDGVNASSFFNLIEVECSHIHESFRVTTTGTVQPTGQIFLNSSCFGDQTTDATSIGYNFVDTAILGMAEGTKIIGGNIEAVNTGIYFGRNCRGIDVNTRWEINATATSRNVIFHTTTEGIHLSGSGVDAANIGAVPSGIEGFSNGGHYLYDRHGNIRSGGNDSSFSGITSPIRAFGEKTIIFEPSSTINFRTTDTGSGTGEFFFQPGGVSASYGAFLRLYANSNATHPGRCEIGPSSGGGDFRVLGGRNGTEWTITKSNEHTPGVDNTSTLGSAALRWSEVFAANATINTSDGAMKQDARSLSESEIAVALKLKAMMKIFRFKDAVDEKGEEARLHCGVVAQSVLATFESEGLDAHKYALFCMDELEDGTKRYGIRYSELFAFIVSVL